MYIILFILGAIFASFFLVMGTKSPINKNYITERSRCDNCNKVLKWYHLIPILSFIFLKGKCSYCKKNIPIENIFYEIFLGLLFAFGYYYFDLTYQLFEYLIISSLLVIIFITDFKYMIIMDSHLIISSLLFILVIIIFEPSLLLEKLLSGIILLVLVLIIKKISDYVFKKESLGLGDVKLAFFMGLSLSLPLGITSFFLSSFLALPYAYASLKLNKKNELPFGPFLISSVLIIFIFQDKFIKVLEFLLT